MKVSGIDLNLADARTDAKVDAAADPQTIGRADTEARSDAQDGADADTRTDRQPAAAARQTASAEDRQTAAREGLVFNIQHFSIQDGPGIRTVVFLKGCPLRCRWCANPESQTPCPQLAWTQGQCIHCRSCEHGLKEYGVKFDSDQILRWQDLPAGSPPADLVEKVCPTQALHVIGRYRTVEDVLAQVEKDRPFYQTSGGGLTISGGEPLMQPSFTTALLARAQEQGISTCIETSGYASFEVFRRVADHLDFLLMDIKCLDPERHLKNTGVPVGSILDNLKQLREAFPDLPIRLRTPVIPGVSDSEDEISRIAALARRYRCQYELLKYHKLGLPKYASLHRNYPMGDAELDDDLFNALRKYAIGDGSF